MDFALMASYSIALSQIINTAHNIDHIEFIWVNGEKIRIDYGTPRFTGAGSVYCGYADYIYSPLIFINTNCDVEKVLKHELIHIKQYQWFYHPNWNETRRPYSEYKLDFEIEAYKNQED